MNFWNRSFRMFNLNSDLLSGAASWDTNYARTYLQISKDQLDKINKIPGWSKTIPEKEKISENVEKQLTQQTSKENILTTITNISTKGSNNLKIQNHNSDLQSKEQSISEKEIFLKNVSLSPLKKHNTSAYLLKRSSSLPDLHQKLQSHNKSEEFSRKRTHSIGRDISSSKLPHLSKKNLLTETYTSLLLSDDGVNPNKFFGHKSFSCPLERSNETSSQKQFKTLDDNVLNRKHLKGATVYVKCNADPYSREEAVPVPCKLEISSFEKRLLQLEKRFSPSKEMDLSPFNAKLMNVENSNCGKYMKSSQNFETAEEVGTIIYGRKSVEILRDKVQNSSVSKSHESLESKPNSQPLNEKNDASNKDGATDISKTVISNFDSFHSAEIPCGQPVPIEVPSQSEPFPSQESAKLSTPRKFPNASLSVPCGQSLPMEVLLGATEPMQSPKLSQLNSPSKSQNANILDNKMMPEKTCGTFSVFSASSNEKASDIVPSKELGTKRKRRSKSEKSSKKLDSKRMKRINILFSSAQIKSMLEIMKLFHTEV